MKTRVYPEGLLPRNKSCYNAVGVILINHDLEGEEYANTPPYTWRCAVYSQSKSN